MTRDTAKLLALFTVTALLIALVVVFGPATAQGAATAEGCFKVDNEDLNGTTVFQIDETHTLTVIHRVVDETLEEINFIVEPFDPIEVGVVTVDIKNGNEVTRVRDYPSPEIEDEIEWSFKHAISHIVLCVEEVTPSTTTTTVPEETTTTEPESDSTTTSVISDTTTTVPSTTTSESDTPTTVTSPATTTTTIPSSPEELPFTGVPALWPLGIGLIGTGALLVRKSLDRKD